MQVGDLADLVGFYWEDYGIVNIGPLAKFLFQK